ncbi:Cas10/Cmr2 second palm domain-containing protein [Cohnella fermenti]|uniref:Cas10/Cmr2 second palm domain-containing protein n=1 Tax=Cohnella fermenti TaxID=2565925 RepID=A0A4S4C9F3_9BACL|nr:hypothetical protein [Cohnella fermenti]THF84692.1 hypothetical protein E6C55_01605 [Cohnella fermenti]
MIVTMYSISGIQGYIFQSNRMRENIGASRIVGQVLKKGLPEALESRRREGIRIISDWEGTTRFSIGEQAEVAIEVVYNGGGSAIVVYRDIEDYHAVNEHLARRLLETSYTLHLAVAAIPSELEDFYQDKEKLELRMETIKNRAIRPQPPGAFPVSEQDGDSGLPITGYDSHVKRPVSTLQRLKLAAGHDVAKNMVSEIEAAEGMGKWALEMKDLIKGNGEDSYVAVVHLDGNGMGRQIGERLRQWRGRGYSEAVAEMRTISKQLTSTYRRLFDLTVAEIEAAMPEESLKLWKKQLPIRPLILDGDDITFICLGEWGIPLAARLLRKLESHSFDESGELSVSSCAGVALVHSHFPFRIAYEVAEECCQQAKRKRVQEGGTDAYLDFKIVQGSNPHHERHEKRYARPFRISTRNDDAGRVDDLSWLAKCLDKLGDGAWPRGRLEQLYAVLLGEPGELDMYLKECGSRGYTLNQICPDWDESGTVPLALIDALELLGRFESWVWEHSPNQMEAGEVLA